MNAPPHPDWNELRTAYKPPAPELDTRAIMDAIRREAVARPLQPVRWSPVAAIPAWACAMAASLAILAAAAVVLHSISAADQTIQQAREHHIPPDQFVQNILPFSVFTL